MIWTRPAVSSRKTRVAAGTVKSMSASALASSGARSVVTAMPFCPRPASSPESRPITAAPAASTAPASETPGIAAIAWISVPPMRPPAPATIRSMSAMTTSLPIRRDIAGRPRQGKEPGALPGLTRGLPGKAGLSIPRSHRTRGPAVSSALSSQSLDHECQDVAAIFDRRKALQIDMAGAGDDPELLRLVGTREHASGLHDRCAIVEHATGDQDRRPHLSNTVDWPQITGGDAKKRRQH